MKHTLIQSFENDNPEPELIEDDTVVEDNTTELTEQFSEIESTTDEIEEISELSDALETIRSIVVNAKEPLSNTAKQLIAFQTSDIYKRLGVTPKENVGLENYSNMSMEGVIGSIGETIVNIFKAIIAGIKKVLSMIGGFFSSLFGRAESVQKQSRVTFTRVETLEKSDSVRTANLIKEVKARARKIVKDANAVDKVKENQKNAEFASKKSTEANNEVIGSSLSIAGKHDVGTISQGCKNYLAILKNTELLATAIQKETNLTTTLVSSINDTEDISIVASKLNNIFYLKDKSVLKGFRKVNAGARQSKTLEFFQSEKFPGNREVYVESNILPFVGVKEIAYSTTDFTLRMARTSLDDQYYSKMDIKTLSTADMKKLTELSDSITNCILSNKQVSVEVNKTLKDALSFLEKESKKITGWRREGPYNSERGLFDKFYKLFGFALKNRIAVSSKYIPSITAYGLKICTGIDRYIKVSMEAYE